MLALLAMPYNVFTCGKLGNFVGEIQLLECEHLNNISSK